MLGRGRLAAFLILVAAVPAVAQEKQPPYWASIASGQAMTRTGPGKNYPGVWLYQRRDLPVRVVKKYDNWRLIQDPDGAQGWMLVTLLSDRRTAIVKPGEPRPIRVGPYDSAKVAYHRRARRRRPYQQVQRRLVPHRGRQSRRLCPDVRHLGCERQ